MQVLYGKVACAALEVALIKQEGRGVGEKSTDLDEGKGRMGFEGPTCSRVVQQAKSQRGDCDL